MEKTTRVVRQMVDKKRSSDNARTSRLRTARLEEKRTRHPRRPIKPVAQNAPPLKLFIAAIRLRAAFSLSQMLKLRQQTLQAHRNWLGGSNELLFSTNRLEVPFMNKPEHSSEKNPLYLPNIVEVKPDAMGDRFEKLTSNLSIPQRRRPRTCRTRALLTVVRVPTLTPSVEDQDSGEVADPSFPC